MATKPEPNLEEQLKAYAELRRQEAATPLEMHPATRRLLQGEVARTYGRTAAEAAPRKNWFAAFWPRLAVGSAVCAALALLLVSLRTERKESSFQMAASQESPPATATTQPALATSPAPAPAKSQSQIADRRSQIAGLADSQSAPVEAGKNVLAPLPAAAVPEQPALARRLERESVDAFKRDADRSAVPAERPMKEEAGRLAERLTELERRSGALPQSRPESLSLMPREPAVAAGTWQLGVGQEKARTAASVSPPVVGASPALPPAKPAPQALAENAARRADRPLAGRAMAEAKESKSEALAMNDQRANSETEVRKKTPDGAGQSVAFTSTADFQSAAGAKAKAVPGQQFRQLDGPEKYRQNFNSPPPSGVLNSFQLEQNGPQVRITDADGSTYLGELMVTERRTDESANGRTGERAGVRTGKLANGRVSDLADSPSRSLAGSQYVLPAGQMFNFRASGTNRSLNQAVVIDGAFLNYGNASVGGVADRKSQGYQQLPLNQLRIQGRAVIGGNSEIPIDAVPAKP